MTAKSRLQSRQQRQPMFAQGEQIATNPAKGDSASQTAETAGDLLVYFDHPKISFSQIVIKTDTKLFQEAQHGFLVFAQPIEQIACRTLFAATSCSSGV
jgi:hypothetical protein